MTEKIYTIYHEGADITFIMKEMYQNGEIKSDELIGFYYGEPNEINTELYKGKLKAEY